MVFQAGSFQSRPARWQLAGNAGENAFHRAAPGVALTLVAPFHLATLRADASLRG